MNRIIVDDLEHHVSMHTGGSVVGDVAKLATHDISIPLDLH